MSYWESIHDWPSWRRRIWSIVLLSSGWRKAVISRKLWRGVV